MNRKQLLVIWAAIAIILILCLFPPWKIVSQSGTLPIEHRFILSRIYGGTIDWSRLLIPLALVIVVSIGLLITFSKKKD